MTENKRSARPEKQARLSAALACAPGLGGDTLRCSFREIQEIDLLPGEFKMIRVLDLAHNMLQSLAGIQQFCALHTIILDYNLLDSVQELTHIPANPTLGKLSLVGNPMALHPNLIPSVLCMFPMLQEINGQGITQATFQEIELGETLATSLVPYFYRNERMLIALDQATKKLNLAFERASLSGWEGAGRQVAELIDRRRKQMPVFPSLPFAPPEAIAPSTLLSLMSLVETRLQPLFPAVEDTYDFEVAKIVHWLYTELILRLHSSGYYELHRYLQRRYYNSPTLDEEFDVEFQEFLLLNPQPAPAFASFPVFSCNSHYLKALYDILESQIQAYETLLGDYKQLQDSIALELEGTIGPESPPNCLTPPQLPSFLLDKSRDSDVAELFPDEYTFRQRELGKELRRARGEAIYRLSLQKRLWKVWKSGLEAKKDFAEQWFRRRTLQQGFSRWKEHWLAALHEEISPIHPIYILRTAFQSLRHHLRKARRDQMLFTRVYSLSRRYRLQLHYKVWRSLFSLPTAPASLPSPLQAPNRPCEGGLVKDIDKLLGKIKAVETSLSVGLGRMKGKGKDGRKAGARKIQPVKANDLHWQIREMAPKRKAN